MAYTNLILSTADPLAAPMPGNVTYNASVRVADKPETFSYRQGETEMFVDGRIQEGDK